MTEVKTVLETYESLHEEAVKVTHGGGQQITSSVGHRYYTQRGWIGAEDLRAGDILQLVNGETVVVEQVQHELLESPQPLYNFVVEDNHNYYVAESVDSDVFDFTLVHNDCSKSYKSHEIEERYNLSKGTYHKEVKPEILKEVRIKNKGKLPYYVGNNPDIYLTKNGDIYLSNVNHKSINGKYNTGLNIKNILKDLGLV